MAGGTDRDPVAPKRAVPGLVLCVCPEEQPVRAPPAQLGANTSGVLGHCLYRGAFSSLEER